MKKFLLIAVLAFAGCVETQTKTDLKRPDFSKRKNQRCGSCCATVKSATVAPVASPSVAPVAKPKPKLY